MKPTRAQIAEHLDLSERHVNRLVKSGVISKSATLDEARVGYIRYLRDHGREGADLNTERARLARLQADAQEMKNAELRRELLRRADVDAAVVGAFSRARQRLLAIPTKTAPVLATQGEPAACQELLRRAVHDALAELASTDVAALATRADDASA